MKDQPTLVPDFAASRCSRIYPGGLKGPAPGSSLLRGSRIAYGPCQALERKSAQTFVQSVLKSHFSKAIVSCTWQ